MNSAERTPAWKAVHAWSEIARESPPKRPADERVCDFHEIYGLFDEAAVRRQASRCLQCPKPQCVAGCPLNNRIPEWLALAAEGQFLEAAALSRSTSNMPEICSRVCPQERLCEGGCILNGRSDPVCIGAIENFINEYAFAHGAVSATPPPPNGRRVAVIGSGPAGLACADELAKLGYAVTVFESQSLPGGLLMNGIPAFKLDKTVVDRRIHLLRQLGVRFELGVTIGPDLPLADLQKQFDAVFLAVGAQKPKTPDIPGADLHGVLQALPFLIQKNSGLPLQLPPVDVSGKRVAVLGGGDTAMDCLRSALRGGAADVVCLYRRDLANMPGSRKEYANALEEGARFLFLTNPVAIESHPGDAARVGAVRCLRMELGAPDAGGRRSPRPVPGSEFTVPADLVLIAYGFDPVPFPPGGEFARVAVTEWGGAVVDANQMTSIPGVFSGGDAARGPSLVVHAVRDGRRAAAGIDRYLASRTGPVERRPGTSQETSQ